MIASRCHRSSMYVHCTNEGTSFYVCEACDRACDTISVTTFDKEIKHEHGHGCETSPLTCAA